MRNQLADLPTADGKPDENRFENCVPTCLAACIQWYDGIKVGADTLKDATYGQGHIGGGAALAYNPYVHARYGLQVSHDNLPSASQAIIDDIRANLRAGRPVIVTMHSQWSRLWNSDSGDGLHVGVAYSIDESDAGNLHIMNPWRGFDHVQPVSWWRARLGNGTYPVARVGLGKGLDGWSDDTADGVLTAPNGHRVIRGFRARVLADAQTPQGWQGGMPYEEEWGDTNASRQLFAAALLEWAPQRGVVVGSMADALALAAHLREGKAA